MEATVDGLPAQGRLGGGGLCDRREQALRTPGKSTLRKGNTSESQGQRRAVRSSFEEQQGGGPTGVGERPGRQMRSSGKDGLNCQTEGALLTEEYGAWRDEDGEMRACSRPGPSSVGLKLWAHGGEQGKVNKTDC